MAKKRDTALDRYQDSQAFCHFLFEAFFAPHGSSCTYYNINWNIQLMYAKDCALLGITYPIISNLRNNNPIPEAILAAWKEGAEKEYKLGKRQQKNLQEFLEAAEKEGISFVVFKGPILANLYPEAAYRISSDTDIFVEMEHHLDVLNFLERHGYRMDNQTSSAQVPAYVNPQTGHRVEVHYTLFEEHSGPRIQLLEDISITNREHYITLPCGKTQITSFGHQEHLLFQIFHFIKHMIVEGINFRGLMDLCLFIQHYSKEISFDLLWEQLDRLGYTKVCQVIFGTCIKYFHMDADIMTGHYMPEVDDYACILMNFSNHATFKMDENSFSLLCQAMDPFVGGNDTKEYEDVIRSKQDLLGPNWTIYAYKLEMLHWFKLTNQDQHMEPIAPLPKDAFLSAEQLLEAKQHAKHYYRAYGITIASEIDMYELFPLDTTDMDLSNIDVYVHYSSYPNTLSHPDAKKIDNQHFHFQSPDCRYFMRNGNEIILEPTKEGLDEKELKPYIISHCLVYTLYMRGIPTIHSSTVAYKERAITIVGDCGAGKSTYSTLLLHNGYQLVADDITAITIDHGRPIAQLSVPQQKYTVDTAEKEGYSLDQLECVEPRRGKYRLLLTPDQMYPHPVPMGGLFELIPDNTQNRLEFIKLEGMEALQTIGRNLFNQAYSNTLGGPSVEVFQTILAIAQNVPIYRILRPTDRDARQEILKFIMDHSK